MDGQCAGSPATCWGCLGQWMQACASLVSVGSAGTDVEMRVSEPAGGLAAGRTSPGRGGIGLRVLNLELIWKHRGSARTLSAALPAGFLNLRPDNPE